MKRTGNAWPQASRAPIALLAAVALALFLAACASSTPPAEVVDAYLSETKRGDVRQALEMWELSELGPAPVDLDPAQQSTRLDGRLELAKGLTEALSMAGERLTWERSGLVYYDIRDGIANVTENVGEANVATVEVDLAIEARGLADAGGAVGLHPVAARRRQLEGHGAGQGADGAEAVSG